MKEKYFIQQFIQNEYGHGGIGCVDMEKMLLSLGFKPLLFPDHHAFSFRAKINRAFFLFRMILSLKSGSVVAFLFPVYARMNRLLLYFLRVKGVKLICIIADIEGIRDDDEALLRSEIRQLKQWKYFIVHNDKMRLLIERLVPGSICSPLYFFDFPAPHVRAERIKTSDIVFAGNLEKSKFLSFLDKVGVHFNIYGPGAPGAILSFANVNYAGIYKPYEMPLVVKGAFGLIWDGDSIESCRGGYGEYLHYNSQHKLSLYIMSSLPVIIWEEAATAELVKQYKIGFTITNLHELADKINVLPAEEYRQMQVNMHSLAEKIGRGEFFHNAMEQLMKRL